MPHDEERIPGDRLAEDMETDQGEKMRHTGDTGKDPYKHSCVNNCQQECCAKPAYRSDVPCRRCAQTVLTVWYCMVCKHVMNEEGPDHTDNNRVQVSLDWPDPPFKVPFRQNVIFCSLCKNDMTYISMYGVGFRERGPLVTFVRFEVEADI